MRFNCSRCFFILVFLSCHSPDRPAFYIGKQASSSNKASKPVAIIQPKANLTQIETGKTTPAQLISFARSLTGTPYKYGSTDPRQGFDCSGFVTYVFNNFQIAVPRTSVDFTHVNHEINLKDAKPGDLILFTGTDSTTKTVGHMGILVTDATQGHTFIHATSGKAYGVTETPLNAYYQGRYMKTIRVFP